MGRLALVLLALLNSPALQANDTESVRLVRPVLGLSPEGSWSLDADVQVSLNSVLADALKRGVPLVFVAEFEVLRKRWYWFDEKIHAQSRSVRLTYHAVTQQYRVAVGDQQVLAYPGLDEALSAALHIRQWPLNAASSEPVLADRIQEIRKSPDGYVVRLRVRLDSGQLPKPLQVNALTNRDWNLSSDWVRPQITSESNHSGS